MPEKPIEYGIRHPQEAFDRRPNESNTPSGPAYTKGSKLGVKGSGGGYATQSKKSGMGDRQQGK